MKKSNKDIKQNSWFKTEVDFENSFKWWFALQWQNKYIQIFLLTFTITVIELCNPIWVYDTISDNFSDSVMGGILSIVGLLIPLVVTSVVSFKGFYQYFIDIKNGTNR